MKQSRLSFTVGVSTKHGTSGSAPSCPPQTQLHHKVYAGIRNLGNTCYVAAALHALAATPALEVLLRGAATTTERTPIAAAVHAILEQLHISRYDKPTAVDVRPLQSVLDSSEEWRANALFFAQPFNSQKDAAEFHGYLIIVMLSELNRTQHPQRATDPRR